MVAFKITLRIVFWCSVVAIVAGLSVFIFLENRGYSIEFIQPSSERNGYTFSFIAMFAGIPLTLTGTLLNAEGFLEVCARIALTAFILFLLYLFMLFSAFSGLCSYSREDILYEHVSNPGSHIVIRSFGCGAVDSEPATPHVFKEEIKWNYFYIYEEADTNNLSASEWKRVAQ